MSKQLSELARKVSSLHFNLVRQLNDVHIFVYQALPLLEEAQGSYKITNPEKDRDYRVPSVKKPKIARRTDVELRQIYDRFISRELFANLIVTAVSQCEAFIFEVLTEVIIAYPRKLTLTVQGVEAIKQVPIEIVLDSSSLNEALLTLVERRLHTVSYAVPRAYLRYFQEVTGVDTSKELFNDYVEIKATRDLLVHNSGIINEIYLSKVDNKNRGDRGEYIPIDAIYFDHCIATMKSLSGIIKKDIEAIFPAR